MKALNFDLGLVKFSINDRCEVEFNPTDVGFIDRAFEAFTELENKQSEYSTELENATDARVVFEYARARDKEMREIINNLFGKDVSADIFGDMNVYAHANGFPVWANLICAVIDQFDLSITEEKAKTTPRMNKYLAKYRRAK